MTVTISRLYNNYDDARAAVRDLEAAGVGHNDISILASNADNWYSDDRKDGTYPDRDLTGKTTAPRRQGRAQGSALLWAALQACSPGLVSWLSQELARWWLPDGWSPLWRAPQPGV
jgi:hypothetical protein